MDGIARDSGFVEGVGQLFAHPFGTGKYQRLPVAVAVCKASLLEDIHDSPVLVISTHHAYLLDDVLVTLQLITVPNHHLVRIVQDFICQLPDLLRPGGREKEGLSVALKLCKDLSDLWLKTHIQHSVCFVKHQLCHCVKTDLTTLEEVVESPRARYDGVNTIPVLSHLILLWASAVHGYNAKANTLPEPVCLCFSLLCQLPSWRHYEQSGPVSLSFVSVPQHFTKRWQQKCQSLTAASGSNADDILAVQR
mmetsp:Transcript_1216/g.2484  ORF Transcript_1216/g.2484 Transcript_1216/m.2484 type:complete len:250 (+) Transcript_1216:682-1431(+)